MFPQLRTSWGRRLSSRIISIHVRVKPWWTHWWRLAKAVGSIGGIGFVLGWIGASRAHRVVYVGLGPANTSFRSIALEAAREMSNRVQSVRFVLCETEGTEDALKKLRPPGGLFGRWSRNDCERLDLAAITDGSQVTNPHSEAVVIAPLSKSYVQVYARRANGIEDVRSLLKQSKNVRLGVPNPGHATWGRACRLLYKVQRGGIATRCEPSAYEDLGFKAVQSGSNTRLVAALLSGGLDAIIIGGPICPAGTGGMSRTSIRALQWPDGLRDTPMDTATYHCLGGATASTAFNWTYLAGTRALRLSKAEIHASLKGLKSLPALFPETEFANYDKLPAWPGWEEQAAAYSLPYSALVTRYQQLASSDQANAYRDTFRDTISLHLPEVQFIGLLLAIVGAALQLGSRFARPKPEVPSQKSDTASAQNHEVSGDA